VDRGETLAAEVRAAMSERWDEFLGGFGEERSRDPDEEFEREGLERLANDAFGWLDEVAAERRGISVEELRLGYLRGRGSRRRFE
jgi:hypothetical protein